ncbi:MAG: hypothetical protein ACU837_02880 [Gammaproteobacteria bacterium]
MKRCVIHIGMPKTGSTSIQYSFSRRLDNPQWKYLDLNGPNHSGALNVILPEDPFLFGGLHRRLGTERDVLLKLQRELRDKLIRELDADAENMLISAELLTTKRTDLSLLLTLRDLVAKHVDSIVVVGYIRPPKGHMESAFQERVKGGCSQLDCDSIYPKYRKRLENLDKAFGKENVVFWKFDPATFPNGCVVQDFCSRLGIDFPVSSISRVNESLSREAVALLYTYRKYGPENILGKAAVNENNLLIRRLSELKGSKLRFSWDLIYPTLHANDADIVWMENRLGESLKEVCQEEESAICSEKDLFCYRSQDLLWLAEQLGPEYVKRCNSQMSSEEVSSWIHTLRLKLAGKDKNVKDDKSMNKVIPIKKNEVSSIKRGKEEMKIKELLQRVKELDPDLAGLDDKKSTVLIRRTFKLIAQDVENTDEGPLNIAGLGKFQIRQVERDKNGKKQIFKRISFKAAKAKVADKGKNK